MISHVTHRHCLYATCVYVPICKMSLNVPLPLLSLLVAYMVTTAHVIIINYLYSLVTSQHYSELLLLSYDHHSLLACLSRGIADESDQQARHPWFVQNIEPDIAGTCTLTLRLLTEHNPVNTGHIKHYTPHLFFYLIQLP